jgi:isopentenyl-diphosphate delta-isomerase
MKKGRKPDHVEIYLNEDTKATHNYWDDIYLIHHALPDMDKDDVELSIKLFGKKLSAPIVISAMTGGYSKAKKINANLAKAASELEIGFGVGSQRPAIEDPSLQETYAVINDHSIPLVIGNLGMPQFINQKGRKKPSFTLESAKAAMEMINADILAIHLNYLQELIQPEGDTNAKGSVAVLKKLASKLPILAKETGAGISRDTALSLKNAKVKGIDVGGFSGTSFVAIEMHRARKGGDKLRERLGQTFIDWGIPTPVSVIESDVGLPIIATGGIRTGRDIGRALIIHAAAAGVAGKLLKPATISSKAVITELETIMEELRSSMFLINASKVSEIRKKDKLITGRTAAWLTALSN